MSLDLDLVTDSGEELFSVNLTHNLAPMARETSLGVLWDGALHNWDELAQELVQPLSEGLVSLVLRKDELRALEPPVEDSTGKRWGTLEDLQRVVEQVLAAAVAHPFALVQRST